MATVPSSSEIQYQQEHIHESRVANLIAANVACLALSFVFVGLRFLSRWMKKIKCEADDWLVVAGLVSCSCESILSDLDLSEVTHEIIDLYLRIHSGGIHLFVRRSLRLLIPGLMKWY